MSNLTLGSLFDGSGGFPLGGLLAGITPVWASEIEPFPIRVTSKRLPFLKHYGNVSEMDGGKIEPVDIITFGSPCQDMSVAGKRAGLDGSRSGLFYEAVRIIKEMRKATDGKYPRWACWENVPGAFSSSGGDDFRCVLECLCGVKDESVSIPKPQKWANAGEILGDGYSIAWRVLDAQYWGVPQRRKRIYLVADFDGGCAGKVLFESEGVSRYSAEGFCSWQRTACGTSDCSGTAGIGFDGYNGSLTDDKSATLGVNCGMSTGRNGIVLNDQGGNRMDITEEVTSTLRAEAHHPPCILEDAVALENHPADGRVKIEEDGTVQTLTERMGTGGNNVPLVLKIRSGCEGGGKGPLIQRDKSATLACNNDQTLFEPCSWDGGQVSPTLTKQNAGGNQRMPDKDNFNCNDPSFLFRLFSYVPLFPNQKFGSRGFFSPGAFFIVYCVADFEPSVVLVRVVVTAVPVLLVVRVALVGVIVPIRPISIVIGIVLICIIVQLLLRVRMSGYTVSFAHCLFSFQSSMISYSTLEPLTRLAWKCEPFAFQCGK